jgi:hypothetical protein
LVSGPSMKGLFVAAAAAPLCFAASLAQAQTTISTNTIIPLDTATFGDIKTVPGGGVTVRTGGPAVTLNSDNSVTDDGTISVRDSLSGGTGILVTTGGGVAGNISIGGALAGDDTVAEVDTDKDGDADGPFVTPGVIRYGVRVTGAGTFTGDIKVTTQTLANGAPDDGVVSIKGDSGSAAISVESKMVGNIIILGSLGAAGDNSYAIRTTGALTGNIDIFGTVHTQGKNASTLSVEAPIDGTVAIQGQITNSGFRYTTPAQSPKGVATNLDADDLLLGGPAIRLASSISRGFIVDSPPPITDFTDVNGDGIVDNLDQDGDGVVDSTERTGIINNYGSAAGVLAGSTSDIVFGNAGTGRDAYGLVFNGVVQSNGAYDGISALGVQVGGLGGKVDTTSGIGISGQIITSSFNADGTGLLIGSGAKVPEILINGGSISAGAKTIAGTVVGTRALQIDSGATVGVLNNSGSIRAGLNGPAGSATAVLDSSGTLAVINNSNTINASVASIDPAVKAVGEAIALDLRANTTGVTYTQGLRASDSLPPTLGGDILFSSGNYNDNVIVNAGVTEGLISFGGGTDLLIADGDSTIRGGIEKGAGTLDVILTNGTLDLNRNAVANVTNLAVGSSSILSFEADPNNVDPTHRVTSLNVSGEANFGAGSELRLSFLSKLLADQSFTILSAGTLNNDGLVTNLAQQVPALFTGDVVISGNQITLDMRRRTAADMQLTGARAAEFDSFYKAFDADPGVNTQILSKTSDADFRKLYEQFLPDYSGGPFKTLANTAREGLQVQAENPAGLQPGQPRSWLQEIGLTVKQETVDDVPYQTGGFGLIGGYERPTKAGGYLGLSGAYMSSEIRNKIRFLGSHLAASAVTGGVYWRQPVDNLVLDADLTGGVAWFDGVRRIVDANAAGQQLLVRQAEANWTGYLAAGRVGGTYTLPIGPIYLRPSANINAVFLNESGYTEKGGGAAVNLSVDSRTNYEAAAEIGLTIGASFGRSYKWGPEFQIGYRSILANGDGDTTAAFASVAGTDFTLSGLAHEKGLLTLRAALRGQGAYSNLAFEAGGEIGEDYEAYMARVVVRFAF